MRALIVAVVLLLGSERGARAEAPAPVPQVNPTPLGRALLHTVSSPRSYRARVREMVAWHGTRTNGCAAMMRTLLGRVGVEIPDVRPAGPWSNPARVTFSLDAVLEERGWIRIADATALAPGDVVFTKGAPDHVMIFHGWADRRRQIARVTDNQRHHYRRPLAPATSSPYAGFGFARRAPDGAATGAPASSGPAIVVP